LRCLDVATELGIDRAHHRPGPIDRTALDRVFFFLQQDRGHQDREYEHGQGDAQGQ
jgi:hypothetical protein